MFCDEIIQEVYECMPKYHNDDVNWFFDCCHDLALHLTKGYRIILKTESFFICIGYDGVKIVPNTENIVSDYVVRCNKCKKATCAEMMVIYAIDNWNKGEIPCDLTGVVIE